MSMFDLKKFLINEGMTRVSRDRKRLLKEWGNEEGEGFGIWDEITPEDINNGLLNGTPEGQHAAKIIYKWYKNEGAFDDFDNVDDFLKFIQEDIYEMLDAATNPEEIRVVKQAVNGLRFDDDFEREVDQEVLDALKRGYKTKSYAWAYDEEDPKSTVIDSVTGMSSFVSRLTDDEYFDLYKELKDAGLMGKNLDESAPEGWSENEHIATVRSGHQFEDVWGHGMSPEDIDIFRDEEDDMYLTGDIKSWDEITPGKYYIWSDQAFDSDEPEAYFGKSVDEIPWTYTFIVSSHSNPYANEGFNLVRLS